MPGEQKLPFHITFNQIQLAIILVCQNCESKSVIKAHKFFSPMPYPSDSQPLRRGTFVCRRIVKVCRQILDI